MTFNTVKDALELLRKNKGIELYLDHCEFQADKEEFMVLDRGFGQVDRVPIQREPKLRLTLTTYVKGHSAPNYQLDYIIFSADLEGKDEKINKHVGDLSKVDEETRQTLRLAWIILNGYKKAIEGIVLKDFCSRIVSYRATAF